MEKKKPSIKEYFKIPNPGLLAYFQHTASGQNDDYRPPFWKEESRESVLARWNKKLLSLNVDKKFPELYAYEQEMRAKVGPMSIQKPLDQRFDSIEQYYTAITKDSKPLSTDAIKSTIQYFRRKGGGIRVRSKRETMWNMRLSTNSGVPYFTKRKLVAKETEQQKIIGNNICEEEILPNATYHPRHGWPVTDVPKYKLAAILGWRGQEGGPTPEDIKQRVIWMMPFLLNVCELQFYQPAIAYMQNNDLLPAYISMDRVDQEVTQLFDTKGADDVVICTDFTAFDQHFNKDMQHAALEVELGLCSDDLTKLHVSKYFNYKFEVPLICNQDVMYTGSHGMGSGSGGTNFDESMAHKVLQFEAAESDGKTLNPHSMAYGDDGILTWPGITVDKVIKTYTSHGQDMNESKQYVSKHDCVVLRRWHSTRYRVNGVMVGVYSTFRALGRLMAQERYYDPEKWSSKMVILRALSILENCKWSPYFHEFVDFVLTGDKFKLGLNLPGFFDELAKLAEESMEEFTDFLGYTKGMQLESRMAYPQPESVRNDPAGINNWEVVKYLKSKIGK